MSVTIRFPLAGLLSLALLLPAAPPAGAQQHGHHGDHPEPSDEVGRVEFPVSCSAEAQPLFETAVAALHSFWFDAALRGFEAVLDADPSCGMAHWGVAMTLLGNPMTRQSPPPERLEAALEAAERAAELAGDGRERAYAGTVLALYEDYRTTDHATRMRAHEEALLALHEGYPDDDEAAIFYGRAVVANAPPDDQTFARQIHAARILEPIFEARPDHPGLAHYIIHAFDAPPIADRGLEAARRYADIAPAAPHALHMPSHIFTRLGHWEASIETNRRSAWAEPDSNGAVHPMDYMVYAYLQRGQDEEAGKVVRRAVSHADEFYGGLLGYNHIAMPARYALERERWAEAAGLRVPEGGAPYVQAVARFARGVGAARSGDAAGARREAAELARIEDGLRDSGDAYWATVTGAQRLAVEAWAARAAGRDGEAIRLAREAAELEETVEKHPVTPGPLLPARELLGDLLLETGHAAEALAEYEATLEREPRRARALHGAGRAAEAAGRADAAAAYYRQLLEVMAEADPERPEPARAREFLAGR